MSYLFLFLVLLPLEVLSRDPEVTTDLCTFRGKTVTALGQKANQFLGVPYGKPPIGESRFRKPVELTEKCNETLIAQSMPKSCFQNLDIAHLIGLQKGVGPDGLSEDCLYLNIWTPSKKPDGKLLPVMFWIHGGAFLIGSASDFNGAKLSITTKTVVVIINYRLGLFGFISGNNTEEMSGNMGLYDQRLAMQWVQKNIKKFGGDPNQVTIFGESAGSMSVSHHMMSPESWPNFQRSICISGTGWEYVQVDRKDWALRKSKALAKFMGCQDSDSSNELSLSVINCLRKKDPFELLKASANETVMSAAPLLSAVLNFRLPGHLFYPVVNEAFIPMAPRKLLKQKIIKPNTDFLAATVFNEIPVRMAIKAEEKPSDAMRRLYTAIPSDYLTQEQINELIKIQFVGINETKYRNDAIQAATQLHANIFFQCPTNYFAQVYSRKHSNSVYQVIFDYKPKNISEPACERDHPCHASDLPFDFGDVTHPKDKKASRKWMNILGNIANNKSLFWPKYFGTNEGKLVPVYYTYKGDYKPHYTQIGFRYYFCKIWKSMALN